MVIYCLTDIYIFFMLPFLICVLIFKLKTKYEPPHDKTNKMACAPSKDSDQPGHPPSLIRVFAVCSMGS